MGLCQWGMLFVGRGLVCELVWCEGLRMRGLWVQCKRVLVGEVMLRESMRSKAMEVSRRVLASMQGAFGGGERQRCS